MTGGVGGSLAAGTYSYEITAATAYGESEPSVPRAGHRGPAGGRAELARGDQRRRADAGPGGASHTGGTGFWGYNIYRQDGGSYGLVDQVPENTSATSSTTYGFTDTGPPRGPAGLQLDLHHGHQPGHRLRSGGRLPATSTAADSLEQEIGLNQAFAAANGLTSYTPAALVTGEHSGLENPNMPAPP